MLLKAVYLESLNIFLYTWRFLKTLEKEEKNKRIKTFYKYFGRVTICLLPAGFYAIFAAYIYEDGRYLEYFFAKKYKQALNFKTKTDKLSAAIGYLTVTLNFISCVILAFVLRLVSKIAAPVKFGKEKVENERKLNKFVTSSHICLIFGYTITSVLNFNIPATNAVNGGSLEIAFKVDTAWTFIGGFSDLFITCMLWFIIEDKHLPTLFM